MAGRKYKPALYELIGKGPLKPDKKGKIATPKWFYGQGPEAVEPVRKTAKVIPVRPFDSAQDLINKGLKKQQAAEQPPAAQPPPLTPSGLTTAKDYSFRLSRKKLRIWAPYWVLGLIALALLLSHLVMYRLGEREEPMARKAAQQAAVDFKDAAPSEALQKVAQGPIRGDVLPTKKVEMSPQSPPTEVAARAATSEVDAQRSSGVMPRRELMAVGTVPSRPLPTEMLEAQVTERQSLIICTLDKFRDLRPVQEYFGQRGVVTEIGKFDNKYVLYSKQTVQSNRDAEAIKMKNMVAQLGLYYNAEKKKGAVIITPDTFRGAYWVRREKIKTDFLGSDTSD